MERNGRIATAYFKVFKGGSINPNIKILKCNIGVFFRVFRLMTVVFVSFFPQLSQSSTGTFGTLPLFFSQWKDPTKAPWTHRRRSERGTPAMSTLLGNLRGWKNLKIEALLQKEKKLSTSTRWAPKNPVINGVSYDSDSD